VLLWLVVFLAVAVVVQARQAAAIGVAGRVARLREERTALEAERAALEREIRLATSRKVLGERAERELGLHLPQDSEFIVFPLNRLR
jgi:cell division protein FtsB